MRHTTLTLATAGLVALSLATAARADHPRPRHEPNNPSPQPTKPPTHPDRRPVSPGKVPQPTPRQLGGTGGVRALKQPEFVKGPNGVQLRTANYAGTYGVKTKGGTLLYKGKDHRQWTRKHYSQAWKCWCWYDPSTGGWYYWSGANGYYQPVSCLTTSAPTPMDQDAAADDLPPDGGDVPVARDDETPDLPGVP